MKSDAGFTLVELMITVVIVAILAGIGYPIYLHYVKDSRRTAAVSALQRAATAEEKYYALHNVYASSLTSLNYDAKKVAIPSAKQDWYTLEVNLDSSGDYVLTATPTSAQSGDACGTYTLTSTGSKSVSGTESLEKCWGSG